jgi:8-oxo-dGTP diphosphatase
MRCPGRKAIAPCSALSGSRVDAVRPRVHSGAPSPLPAQQPPVAESVRFFAWRSVTFNRYTVLAAMPTLGVFAAIFDKQQRILCVRLNYAPHSWTTPGGRVDPGESPIKALEREVHEEVALEVAVGTLLGVYSKPKKDDLVLSFAARIIREHPWHPNVEIGEIGYFLPTDLPAPMSPAARMRILDAASGRAGVFRVVTEDVRMSSRPRLDE